MLLVVLLVIAVLIGIGGIWMLVHARARAARMKQVREYALPVDARGEGRLTLPPLDGVWGAEFSLHYKGPAHDPARFRARILEIPWRLRVQDRHLEVRGEATAQDGRLLFWLGVCRRLAAKKLETAADGASSYPME